MFVFVSSMVTWPGCLPALSQWRLGPRQPLVHKKAGVEHKWMRTTSVLFSLNKSDISRKTSVTLDDLKIRNLPSAAAYCELLNIVQTIINY